MSVWLKNLRSALGDHSVVILHGNVRDRYIDESSGRIYDNLTALLKDTIQNLPVSYQQVMVLDPLRGSRVIAGEEDVLASAPADSPADDDIGGASARRASRGETGGDITTRTVVTVLKEWNTKFRDKENNHINCIGVLYYLDKIVGYQANYSGDALTTLLLLEQIIDNIRPNHRLIMVALQDSMVPVELYTNAPKTKIVSIPKPDKNDRRSYIHRLLGQHKYLDALADLTEGMYLHDLDNIIGDVRDAANPGSREITRIINKYRIGEQEDYWGQISVKKLDGARDWFINKEGVEGQYEAITRVWKMLCLARTGMSGMASGTTSKPKGVLFFAGPTGVGKTLVAKKIAKFLFSTEEAFHRFDMSELKEEHSVSKLIGSPPGYVGFESGGALTNAVRDRPFSVVLFDEIEKAHPRIMDIFLQILDEGRLTDSRGQTIFFSETVIVFTSNIGTRSMDSRGREIEENAGLQAILTDAKQSEEEKKAAVSRHFVESVEEFFMHEISRPELLNRIGNNIVPFNYINSIETQRKIVEDVLRRIKTAFEDRYKTFGNTLLFDQTLTQMLINCYSDKMALNGGRGITNAIEDEALRPLSTALLKAEENGKRAVRFAVSVQNEKVVVEER